MVRQTLWDNQGSQLTVCVFKEALQSYFGVVSLVAFGKRLTVLVSACLAAFT